MTSSVLTTSLFALVATSGVNAFFVGSPATVASTNRHLATPSRVNVNVNTLRGRFKLLAFAYLKCKGGGPMLFCDDFVCCDDCDLMLKVVRFMMLMLVMGDGCDAYAYDNIIQ